jgi:hypothetical protein
MTASIHSANQDEPVSQCTATAVVYQSKIEAIPAFGIEPCGIAPRDIRLSYYRKGAMIPAS